MLSSFFSVVIVSPQKIPPENQWYSLLFQNFKNRQTLAVHSKIFCKKNPDENRDLDEYFLVVGKNEGEENGETRRFF
jgi:hypothetical protein